MLKVPWFKNKRSSKHEGNYKRLNIGGKGLGFKERPGFGGKSGETNKVIDKFSIINNSHNRHTKSPLVHSKPLNKDARGK